jgi:spore coat polysaccharide biosynthesis protein SpsF (cytidylyltransferase family)
MTAPRVIAVIQARLGSTRLPGKILAEIAGRPMLAHVLQRTAAIPGVDGVVLATTVEPRDEPLVDWAVSMGVPCVTGSEEDVLDRFHAVLTRHPADAVVRVTPDCPLLDPEVAGLVVAEWRHRAGDVDYVSNTHPPTFPDGLDVEVMSRDALDTAWREAGLPSEREHVTAFIWNRPAHFRLVNVVHSEDLSAYRWTVDTAADLDFVRAVYARLDEAGTGRFGMRDVLALLRDHPELGTVNAGQHRNEGYQRSLVRDAALSRGRRP